MKMMLMLIKQQVTISSFSFLSSLINNQQYFLQLSYFETNNGVLQLHLSSLLMVGKKVQYKNLVNFQKAYFWVIACILSYKHWMCRVMHGSFVTAKKVLDSNISLFVNDIIPKLPQFIWFLLDIINEEFDVFIQVFHDNSFIWVI